MRRLKIVYLLLGLGLLGWVLFDTDLVDVAARLRQVGWGIGLVLVLSFVVMGIDALTWQMALRSVPLDTSWFYRMLRVRLVGEAFNSVVPAGGFGGEPLKAMLLNRHYGVAYRESAASIVMGRTVNMMAQVPFLAGGIALTLLSTMLPNSYKMTLGIGLLLFTLATLLLFATQRFRLGSLLLERVRRWRMGRPLAAGAREMAELEGRFVGFYVGNSRLLGLAFALALANWFVGTTEIYCILTFLGHPVSFLDAWIIEAAAQLVRAATFFIPASLGAQEGGFLLICAALTGLPPLGLAVALLRRLREIVWIGAGFALGFWYSTRAARVAR